MSYKCRLVSFLFSLFAFSNLMFGQIEISSLEELVEYSTKDNVDVKLAPGQYFISVGLTGEDNLFPNATLMDFTGKGSTYDFDETLIYVGTNVFQAFGSVAVEEMRISGEDITIKNLTIEDYVVTGYERPSKTALGIKLDGKRNTVDNAYLTVRASYPYGYGDVFGKGGTNTVIKHYKHAAILVRGEDNHVKNTTVIQRAYGHGIFMQGALNPTIEGCYVEGDEMRTTDDILLEEGTAAADVEFMTTWGYTLPAGYMISKQEDGIRAYGSGVRFGGEDEEASNTENVTVIDCTVKHMRGSYSLTAASGTIYASGCTAIECEGGFSAGSNATIIDCYADAKYSPVYSTAYSTRKNSNVEITVLNSEGGYGNDCLAYMGGSTNNFTLRSEDSVITTDHKIMLSGDRMTLRHLNGVNPSQDNVGATSVVLNNYTYYPVVCADDTKTCTINSYVSTTDVGTSNSVSIVEPVASSIDVVTSQVSFYPNPVQDVLRISGLDLGETTVNIISLSGQQILTTSVNSTNNELEFDLSSLSAGVYILSAKSNDSVLVKRFVKQ